MSLKIPIAILATTMMLQGCGLVALGAIKQNAANTTDWASRAEQMNCTQMRTELARLQSGAGVFANMIPGNNSAIKISALTTQMRRRGCRILA